MTLSPKPPKHKAIRNEWKTTKILTGHVKSNGKLIGFIDVPSCGWVLVAVRLNVLSPRILVAAAPNVHDDVVSISAWYCLRQMRNLVLQLPWHEPFGSAFWLQQRPNVFRPLSFLKDCNLNSKSPEHEICELEKWEKCWIRNGMRFCIVSQFNFHQKNLCYTKTELNGRRKNLEIELNTINYEN